MVTNQRKLQHFYWRAGFGPDLSQKQLNNMSIESEIEKAFAAAKNISFLDSIEYTGVTPMERAGMTKEQRKQSQKKSKESILGLNRGWFEKMVSGDSFLLEKMTLFWAGMLTCRSLSPKRAQDYINTIRQHALGKFSDLLTGISKQPAMIRYLDNQSNRRQHPNENFAREVMELFTLGIGSYSENDVKEAARAFTGWTVDGAGNFEFRERTHDTGTKTFLGQTGNFNGDDILRIILQQKQCAKYVATRIYRHFVNDVTDETIVSKLSEDFYKSGYDISKLMRTIFTADWFYEEKNIGVKIKPPIVLMANLSKNFSIQFEDNRGLIGIQKILGQFLLNPANVAGWPEGKSWIDSSTLMFRMRLPRILLAGLQNNTRPKSEFDAQAEREDSDNMSMMDTPVPQRRLKTRSSWQEFYTRFSGVKEEAIEEQVAAFLVQTNSPSPGNLTGTTKEEKIKSAALHIMSMPEYQLC